MPGDNSGDEKKHKKRVRFKVDDAQNNIHSSVSSSDPMQENMPDDISEITDDSDLSGSNYNSTPILRKMLTTHRSVQNKHYDEIHEFDDPSCSSDDEFIDIYDDDNEEDDASRNSPGRGSLWACGKPDDYPDIVIYAHHGNNPTSLQPTSLNTIQSVIQNIRLKNQYYTADIPVIAPHSGETFHLGEQRSKPHQKGVTHAHYKFKRDTPPSDDVLALTVMNMIENVISKGNSLNLRTTSPFVAQIAALYIEELNKIEGFNIKYTLLSDIDLKNPTHSEAVNKATTAFTTINKKMKISENLPLHTPPWFEAAKVHCAPALSNSNTLRR